MAKIKSLLIKRKSLSSLKETYEKIYQDENIWKFSKFDGVHAVIWNLLKDKINNSSILDVGCGSGRLTFYLGLNSKRVLGIDFSTKAIEKANFLRSFLNIQSVEFRVDKLKNIDEKFDVIVFADVIEHVKNQYKY